MSVIKRKEYPRIDALIRRAMPQYRKHSVILFDYGRFTNYGSYWDGGSRTFWATANIDGSGLKTVNGPAAPALFSKAEPVTVELDDKTVGISTGTFRGKPATVTIVATQKTANWLLGK